MVKQLMSAQGTAGKKGRPTKGGSKKKKSGGRRMGPLGNMGFGDMKKIQDMLSGLDK